MKMLDSAWRGASGLAGCLRPWALAVTCVLAGASLAAGDDLAGKPGQAMTQPPVEPTSELLVFLRPGVNAPGLAQAHGLAIRHRLQSDPDAYVMAAPSAAAAAVARARLAADPQVRGVYPNERAGHVKMAFVPNDPYFHRDTPLAGWNGQWHLVNEYVAGRDARVQGAWNQDVTGLGVTIGIVDDGLQTAHPDLAPNYVAADSYDFGQNDPDPNPFYTTGNPSTQDNHGTSVAGVAAARGGNGIGVTGAAPLASLAGLREDFHVGTIAQFVDGTLYHSSGANTSIAVKNHSYGIPSPYVPSSAEVSALATSAAAGTIHCFAAGNGRGTSGQDSNKMDLQNSPECITVAAMGSDGKYASYSSFGAPVFVTAPSNSGTGFAGITTTDRTTEGDGYNGSGDSFPNADYTSQFGGTSSATPLVSGVMALVKQARPAVDVRFAKHLLVRTSDVVDSGDVTEQGDGGWKTNAAGYLFNQNYGFGLIDAAELVQTVPQYSGVTPLTTAGSGTVAVGASIPDASATGISRSVSVSPADPQPLEEVLVTLNITHTFRGDLEAFVTSPGGTVSRLMIRSGTDGADNISWTFLTNAFWGESPGGTWTVRVRDMFATDVGAWTSYAIVLRMGELVLTGDLDGDGHVDVVDLLIFADSWPKCEGDPGFNPICDFNQDGCVDVTDLLILSENWGT